jgi:hypothetical protein
VRRWVLAAAIAVGGCTSPNGQGAPSVSGASTTTTATFDSATTTTDLPALVGACQEYVPLAAFMGDPEMQQLWADVGQDAAALTLRCAQMGESDPARLAGMTDELAALRGVLDPTTTPAPPVPETAASSGPAAPEVSLPDTGAPLDAAPIPAVPAAPVTTPLMPNVVCMRLPAADEAIRSAGGAAARTFDATGAGRPAAIDGTWIVVTQSPGPGLPMIDAGPLVGVVKVVEPHPC